MAEISNLETNGLHVAGTATFATMPMVDGRPVRRIESIGGFIPCGPYIRFVLPLSHHTSIFNQDPLSTTPQQVNPNTTFIPEHLYGKIEFLDLWIESANTTGSEGDVERAIFNTRRRGETFTGDAQWQRRGFLHQGATRWYDEYRVVTDDQGRFDIWSYSGVWQHRITRMYVRGIGLKA